MGPKNTMGCRQVLDVPAGVSAWVKMSQGCDLCTALGATQWVKG